MGISINAKVNCADGSVPSNLTGALLSAPGLSPDFPQLGEANTPRSKGCSRGVFGV
jgi:hypothetical protein